MKPRIEIAEENKLVGNRRRMCLSGDKTSELWKIFMPKRKEINNNLTTDLISMQVYEPSYFNPFNPEKEFEKWAAVEVNDFTNVPSEMEIYTLPKGMYAVFKHKGLSADNSTFQYIFTSWLPDSEYELDNRPHFEILGDKYINGSIDSEEEIWIPVKYKN